MLQAVTLPPSLGVLVEVFRSCFTAPSFRSFTVLLAGLISCTETRTVCGMLTASGWAGQRHHDWAHRFFASARWSADAVGLALAGLVLNRLVAVDAPVVVAVDDTLFRRSGRKIHGAGWHRDPTSPARGKASGWGHCWVVVGILVWLPFASRPVCLPVLARLFRPGKAAKPELAQELITQLVARWPQRQWHVVADALYGTRHWRELPEGVTITTRPRSNACLHEIHTPIPGAVGRPRYKGDKITLADIAENHAWRQVTVTRYGRTATTQITEHVCLWPNVLRRRHVRVILVRDSDTTRRGRAWDLVLITTDLHSPAATIVERYAARWAIEVTFHDAKHILGAGQARNRTPSAVERTLPFALTCYSLVIIWYATAGYHPDDVNQRRLIAPWYRTKTDPSYADMLTKLRKTIIAEQFRPTTPRPATTAETHAIHLAWTAAAA